MKGRRKKGQSQGTHDSGDWDPGSFLNMGWSLQVCVWGGSLVIGVKEPTKNRKPGAGFEAAAAHRLGLE